VTYVDHGRCRSGHSWFWYAAALDYDYPRCDDPVCEPGLHPHEYGWEDTEDLALKAMAEAVARLGGEVRQGCYQGSAPGRASAAAAALKRINSTRRKARPPKTGASNAAPAEYLYEPWYWTDYDNPPYETHKGITEIPIAKKTAKRIYYDRTDRWDRDSGVVTLGYIDRQDFEADTRCRAICPRNIPAGLVCGPHGRDFPHCVHFGEQDRRDPRHYDPRGCGETCLVDTPGMQCAEHGFAWDHCPHRSSPGECWHGYPAGCARLPGDTWYSRGGTAYATREAAEEHLYGREREQERKRQEAEPGLRQLRREMAACHPDRGGTDEEFIAARERYERALRKAS
jgi:hypothetical protein